MVKSRPLSVVLPPVQVPTCVRVKKAIDDIIAQLMVEKNDEIKHKAFCVEEFNTNQVQTERKKTEQQDLLALIKPGATMCSSRIASMAWRLCNQGEWKLQPCRHADHEAEEEARCTKALQFMNCIDDMAAVKSRRTEMSTLQAR